MNKVILIGRATKDFELRYTPNGVAVANGTIAVDRPYQKDKEKEADFINIQAWKQTAETAANYIKKGHKFAVEGRLQVRNYENNEGRRVYVTEVVAERVEFLEKRERAEHNGDYPDAGGTYTAPEEKPIDISDDDLPF